MWLLSEGKNAVRKNARHDCRASGATSGRDRLRRDNNGARSGTAKWWIFVLVCATLSAGPVEFGVADFNAALASRNLKWKLKYELTLDPPETYRIEPYKFGGAHITGGDLRGLMYGLLDAADQIRASGRVKQTQAAPVIHERGVRMPVHAAETESFDWQGYISTLARDRFNRFTLVFLDAPFGSAKTLATISQLCAEFGIEFTLGLREPADHVHDSLRALLAACPLIRTLQWRSDSADIEPYREVLKALHETGRRVAIEPVGALATPEFAKVAAEAGVALYSERADWPPGFAADLPADFKDHALLYWMWGTLGYDPKAQHGEKAADLAAAARIIALLGEAQSGSSEWIANGAETVRNHENHLASAKRTPLEISDGLLASAAALESTTVPDLKMLAAAALARAHEIREQLPGIGQEGSRQDKPPRVIHVPVRSGVAGQPINVAIELGASKEIRSVRLHYRAASESGATNAIEKPAAPSMTFTIPPATSDLIYFFEILTRDSGWFEPDPFTTFTGAPYFSIKIEAK